MLAKTDMQIERIKHLSPNPGDGYYNETDEYLAKYENDVLQTCNGPRSLVPSIFPQHTEEHRVLYHDDLSDTNIILDSTTLELKGIIDWESVGICPSWQVTKAPVFLRGNEVPEPPPVGAPGVDEWEFVEIRKDWVKVCLRKLYIEGVPEARVTRDIKRKLNFAQSLEEMELRWQAARRWTPILADPDSE
ncbi:hypothetical protein BDW62DRAFT_120348 [Aspergillus aurantiobrunneus]